MPGLAHLSTVEYNHTKILTKVNTTGPVKIFKNDMRLDMIEAAKMANVDYTVQIMYSDHLRPTHIWAGDIVDAHHAGCRVAAKTYCTPTIQGCGYRGGQCVSAECAGLPWRVVGEVFSAGRRDGRRDHTASTGH